MRHQKIRRYRIMINRTFPINNPMEGEETGFIKKIENAVYGKCYRCTAKIIPIACMDFECQKFEIEKKLHIILANYPLWQKRMEKVEAGKAVIELCYWLGRPRRSERVVLTTLDKDSGCGVQELRFLMTGIRYPYVNGIGQAVSCIAKNDGLSLEDFKEWFKGYDLSEPLAIIHFTKFRY